MKINHLDVRGFGHWSGLRIDDLDGGLNLFYGPNEAGKTTLLEFMRGVLYGWQSARRRRYLPPLAGPPAGGSLSVSTSAGRFRIERLDETVAGQPYHETLRITDAHGTPHDPALVDTLRGGVDEATFNHVFAIGLGELQRLDTLSDTQAAEYLFRISAGLDRVSLIDVLEQLRRSRHRLLSDPGRPSRTSQLLERRQQILDEMKPLGSLTRQYAGLCERRSDNERQVAHLDEQIKSLEQRKRLIEAALSVRESWHERHELNIRLADVPTAGRLPAGALSRLDRLTEQIDRCRQRLRRTNKQGRKVARQHKKLDHETGLERHALQIEALLEQRPWISEEQRRIEHLEGEIRRLRVELGAGEDDATVFSSNQTGKLKRLRRLARELATAERTHQDLLNQRQPLTKQSAQFDSQMDQSLSGKHQGDVTSALEQCGERVTTLRRRVQIDERIEKLIAQQRELGEETEGLVEVQLLPPWLLTALGAVFALGFALLLLTFVLPSGIIGTAGWALAGLGGTGLAGAIAAKFYYEYTSSRRLDSAQRQADVVASQLDQVKKERKELDAQIPSGSGSLHTRLAAAERELEALERAMPLQSQRTALGSEIDLLNAKIADAEQLQLELTERWEAALEDHGLPEDFSPRDLRRLAREQGAQQSLRIELQQRQQELAARRRSLESVQLRILEVAELAKVAIDTDRLTLALDALSARLREHQATSQRRQALATRLKRLKRRRRGLRSQLSKMTRRRRRLLYKAGIADEDEFRRLARQQAQWERLARRRDGLSTEIATALAGQSSEEALESLIQESSETQLREQLEGLGHRLEQLELRQRQLLEERGQLTHELKTLAENNRLPKMRIELQRIEAELAQVVQRWRVLALTHQIGDSIRQAYESHRQPETLQRASTYLRRLTDGRYGRVWTPVGSGALRVDDKHGQPLTIEVLSRGTREQLFLALRLALAESYSGRGIELPLILDDLLVNFDTHRAESAAAVLNDFAAKGHQLLVFTCHEHMVAMFESLRATVRRLPSARGEKVVAAPPRPRIAALHPEPPKPIIATAKSEPPRPTIAAVKPRPTQTKTRPEPPARPMPPRPRPTKVAVAPKSADAVAPKTKPKPQTVVPPQKPVERPTVPLPTPNSVQVVRFLGATSALYDPATEVIIVEADEGRTAPPLTEPRVPSGDQVETLTFPHAPTAADQEGVTVGSHATGMVYRPSPNGAEEFAGEFAERVLWSYPRAHDSHRRADWNGTSVTKKTVHEAPIALGGIDDYPRPWDAVSLVVDDQHSAPISFDAPPAPLAQTVQPVAQHIANPGPPLPHISLTAAVDDGLYVMDDEPADLEATADDDDVAAA